MEGKKQNQLESDKLNEFKYKNAEEKQKNEELNVYLLRLQNNMISSTVGLNKNQPSNKKGDQQRRIWSGKFDNTFSPNNILETIEENDNTHQPSESLANYGCLNEEFKTPLESFEWNFEREKDSTAIIEFTNNENTEHKLSSPSKIPLSVCETPKKVLRERVNNYKHLFEISIKENNELREFTTLEKQMFYDNNEQLKDLSNLRKQVDILQIEKNESEKMIEKQKINFEKRENELLAIIQEIKEELKSKEDQINKSILSFNFIAEKQEEIKRLEMKIKEMYQLNDTYINEINTLKLQLSNKDKQLNVELSKQCSLFNELSLLQSYVAEVKSVPSAIQFLTDEGYFSLEKCKILGLVQLLEQIHDTVEQLQQQNQNLIDENNNFKLITNDFNIQMNNTKKESNELRLKLNSIEEKIMFSIKEFSGSSEVNIDNSDMDSLIDFAVKNFEENSNKIDILLNKNLILKEKLSLFNIKLSEIISFVFNNIDNILQNISTFEVKSSTEMEKLKKEFSKTTEENTFLKSSIQAFNILTFECVDMIETVQINQSKIRNLQEELNTCNGIKNELKLQIEELNTLNKNHIEIEKQIKDELDDSKFELPLKNKEMEERRIASNFENENEIRNELIIKTKELEIAISQVNILQLTIEEMKIKSYYNDTIIEKLNTTLDVIKFELGEKSKLVNELKNNKSEATICNYLEAIHELNNIITKLKTKLEDKLINKKTLNNELQIVLVELDNAIVKIDEVKSEIDIFNTKDESNIAIMEQFKYDLKCVKSTLDELNELIKKLENINLEHLTECKNSDHINKIITELKINLENKMNVENEVQNNVIDKTIELKYPILQENEVQIVIESMENEIKSNVVLIDQLKSESSTKSDLLTKLENVSFELISTMVNNMKDKDQYGIRIQNQLQLVIKEKSLLLKDLNLINQKFFYIAKYHEKIKNNLEVEVQLHLLNYHNLYTEFINLSCDIESLLKYQTITVSNLTEEIQIKSTEIKNLEKQLLESSLHQKYDRLEEKCMFKSCECDKARDKIVHLESILSENEEYDKVLKKDSFHIKVNDFKDNVLVDLNEKMLLEEKEILEYNLNILQEKLIDVIKEMELRGKNCEDLTSIINVLTIEINDANSVKQNLKSCLNEAEHELLKSGDLCENLKLELYSVQRELENACIKTECIEKELQNIEFKFNDKINKTYLDGCDVRNQLIDPLVDYVHDIKLKLTELNSAMISGNQSEKRFRTKVMLVDDDILSYDETWKINCDYQLESPNGRIGVEIDNLHKILKEKNILINTLQTAKNEMEKKNYELQCQMRKKSDENNKYVNNVQFIKNDLKEKILLVSDLNNELNQVQLLNTKLKVQINELREYIMKLSDENEKLINNLTLTENNLKDKTLLVCNLKDEINKLKIEYTKLEEHNQENKRKIDNSYDIDLELRNGKKNIINEINLLEPGKITGVLTDHNLSNLLDMFVNLIIIKEHQIVSDLVSNQNKTKQLYEDKIKQMQEDIKKGKEWQEQVESDNDKLSLELENFKLQKNNFSVKEIMIKELTEKVLEAENLSFNYLSELEEIKTQLDKTNEQNYQSLLHEFEEFKINSEQSIQDLKNKLENQTKQYNKSLILCEVQKSSFSSLEDQIDKIQSECAYLKSIIEKKDEDIKHLLVEFKLKTNEYEIMIEKYNLEKEEMKNLYEKTINDLQLDISNVKHKLYCTEKLLKEINKNNEKNQIKFKINDHDLIEVNNITEKLRTILKCNGTLPIIYENICLLMTKCEHLEGEIKELKHANVNLDNECDSMLEEVNNKDNKITELLTQVDILKKNVESLTEERDLLKNKCKQYKNVNNDIKKLNDEICSYEQNIYELRKDKGQLIIQHNKELKQLKNELQEVQTKNLEMFNEYSTLSETARNLEKTLKEDIQHLNRCIVDKNAKISTLELFFKTYSDDLKKKYHELEIVLKRAKDENRMLRRELHQLNEIKKASTADKCTQTIEDQSLADQKCMVNKIAKFENDSKMMKMMLHHRKSKIEELEKQLNERHCRI